jgi:pyruvate/2-oxoglutarate dehydrogenase complex dihydrolipoamide acyltransferase (E2) component
MQIQHIQIVLPELGTGPAILGCWFADHGEMVFAGDRLLEILVEGATFDVPAPATGKLLEKTAFPRDLVHPGQVLGVVEAEGQTP